MPEKFGSSTIEQENIEKLGHFIENLAERYRALDIPLGNDGRVDMEGYSGMYPDIAQDLKRNQEWEEKWQAEGQIADRKQTDGEKLEMLAYAVFAKNLGEKFIVVRSSPHDDRVNKVDTLILDCETGNLVCAFDEVGETSGPVYEKKQAAVQERNLNGGTFVKYGIGVDEKDGEKLIMLSSESNVPVFYIALPKDRIEKGIQEFLPEIDKQSDFEKKLFTYFTAILTAQISGLELYNKRLDPHLKVRLAAFKKSPH